MKVLETERLLIRHFEPDDLDAIYAAVYSDPEVCRFFCGETRPIEQIRAWIPYRGYQSRHDEFGLMAVVVKATSELIGLCGIQAYVAPWQILEDEPDRPYPLVEVELTYAFGKSAWGKGYATEACLPMIDHAFTDAKLGRLVTGCDPLNQRAARLQERLGMRKVRNIYPDANEGELVGVLDNPAYAHAGD